MNKTPNKRKSPSQPKSKIAKKDSFAVKENFQDGQSIWFKYPLFWIPFAGVFSIMVWILATKDDASIFSFTSIYNNWPSLTWRATKVVFTWLGLELLLLIVVPGKREQGPHAPSGYRPTYRANGVACYLIVNALVLAANYMGVISLSYVYDILGEIFLVSNIAALFFCLFLYFKGIYFPSSDDVAVTPGFKNFSNEYFWGIELHPSITGIEIKQLINCRYAMMGWQMLLWVYAAKQYTLYGHFSNAMIVSVLLQTAYIFKFFNWEVGYFHTIDIAHDKLGFYICWGCCAWLPPTYTVPAMYIASHPGTIGVIPSVVVTAIGLLSIYLNYETDLQKQYTRQHNGNNLIWGRKPKVMRVKYNSFDGVERENILLIDGYWSYARHLNYVFELALAFCWTLPAGFSTVVPYIYFLQLTGLLVDRTHRDNTRCSIKYGDSWKEYCKVVKYNMIPGVF